MFFVHPPCCYFRRHDERSLQSIVTHGISIYHVYIRTLIPRSCIFSLHSNLSRTYSSFIDAILDWFDQVVPYGFYTSTTNDKLNMSPSGIASGSSAGPTPTLAERLQPLNNLLRANPGGWNLVRAQVNVIQEDFSRRYFQEHESRDPLDLTIGVEIEAGLLQNTDIASRWSSDNDISAAQEAVHYALSKPLTKTCSRCNQAHNYRIPLNPLRKELFGLMPTCLGYDKWTVGFDITVDAESLRDEFKNLLSSPDSPRQFEFHGFELRSRIMGTTNNICADSTTSCPHRPEITYQEEIRGVYYLLKNTFLNPSANEHDRAWRLMVTESCGLHVHIGNGANRLPLETVKNIVSLYTANERQIDNMHSRNRITGSTLLLDPDLNKEDNGLQDRLLPLPNGKLVYNSPLSAHFAFLAHCNRNNLEHYKLTQPRSRNGECYPHIHFTSDPTLMFHAFATSAHAWCHVIHGARRIDHLQDLQALASHSATVNLQNMKPVKLLKSPTAVRTTVDKNTIEFRQAAGTLDAVAVLAWMDVLVHLVMYSHSHSSEEVLEECTRIWRDEKFSTLDFLSLLELGPKQKEEREKEQSGTFGFYKSVLGLNKEKQTYAETRLSSEFNLADSFHNLRQGEDDHEDPFFTRIVKANSQILCQELSPRAVNQRIQEKFLALGYGQFEEKYLADLAYEKDWPAGDIDGQDGIRRKLGMGWEFSGSSFSGSSISSLSSCSGDEDEDED